MANLFIILQGVYQNDMRITDVKFPYLNQFDGVRFSQAIAQSLTNNYTLRSLDLSECHLGRAGSILVLNALHTNTTLETLNIGKNIVSEHGEEFGDAVARLLRSNTTLETLNIEANIIGDDGGDLIAHELKTNTTLTSINLRYNNLGVQFSETLVDVINTNTTLTELDLIENNLEPSVQEELVRAVKSNSTLTQLRLIPFNHTVDPRQRMQTPFLIEKIYEIDDILKDRKPASTLSVKSALVSRPRQTSSHRVNLLF